MESFFEIGIVVNTVIAIILFIIHLKIKNKKRNLH